MTGIADLLPIEARYLTAGKQVILKSDLVSIIEAILAPLPRASQPPLVWVDNATCRVEALADSPATVLMSGFPNILNPTETVTGGLTDGGSRAVTANVACNFGIGSNLWGAEKVSQWYAILALAADADTTFTLKAMPYLRVHAQVGQVIDLGTNLDASVHLGYGFTANEFDGGMIYVLSGAAKGLMREVAANTNGGTSPSTVTYTGTALSLAAGDWFIILPPGTNFRWLGDVWNASTGHYADPNVFGSFLFGKPSYTYTAAGTYDFWTPLTWPLTNSCRVTGIGGGAGGENAAVGRGGGAGTKVYKSLQSPVPGTYYLITVGAGGAHDAVGQASSIGALLSLAGGALNWSTGWTVSDETGPLMSTPGPGQDGLWGGGGPPVATLGNGFSPGAGGAGSLASADAGAGVAGYLEIVKA